MNTKPRTVKIAFRTVVIKKMTKRQYLAYYRKEFARMGVRDRKLIKMPPDMINYRHPDPAFIERCRGSRTVERGGSHEKRA